MENMRFDALVDWPVDYTTAPALYIVGGCVRDMLMGRESKDIDLVCHGALGFAAALAARADAALVPMQKKPDEPCYRVVDRADPDRFIDIAEMRGASIDEDLGRRDFTINSIAVEITRDGAGEILDPLDGRADIEARIIRLSGPDAISGDPLRILRAVRFASTLGFAIDPDAIDEMKRLAPSLSIVSGERIWAELKLILDAPAAARYFGLMDSLGALEILLPATASMKACTQTGYHDKDVFHHAISVLQHVEEIAGNPDRYFGAEGARVAEVMESDGRMALLKLGAYIHDMGKPECREYNEQRDQITFYGHEAIGAKMTEELALSMRMSGAERDFLVRIVAEHMHPPPLAGDVVRPATLVRWIRKMGDDMISSLILSMADMMGKSGRMADDGENNRFRAWCARTVGDYFHLIKPRLIKKLLVSGDDLIAMGIAPGPGMGRMLDEIRLAQDTGEIVTREDALERLGEIMRRGPE